MKTISKLLQFATFFLISAIAIPCVSANRQTPVNMRGHSINSGSGRIRVYDPPIVCWHEDLDMLSVVFVCDEPTLLSIECSDGGIITQFPITTDGWENYYWIGSIPSDSYTIIIENDYARFEGELIIP